VCGVSDGDYAAPCRRLLGALPHAADPLLLPLTATPADVTPATAQSVAEPPHIFQ